MTNTVPSPDTCPQFISDADSEMEATVTLREDELVVLSNLLSNPLQAEMEPNETGLRSFRLNLFDRINEQFYAEESVEAGDSPRDALTVLEDSSDLYERKNADYGDSWRAVGEMLAVLLTHQGVEELTVPVTPEHLNSLGLFFRRGDKYTREFNGWFLTDEMQVEESIAETHQDDVPYGAMHTELAETMAAGADPDSTDGDAESHPWEKPTDD